MTQDSDYYSEDEGRRNLNCDCEEEECEDFHDGDEELIDRRGFLSEMIKGSERSFVFLIGGTGVIFIGTSVMLGIKGHFLAMVINCLFGLLVIALGVSQTPLADMFKEYHDTGKERKLADKESNKIGKPPSWHPDNL